MKKRPNLYIHEVTGTIVDATKKGAKKLPPEYKKIRFITNDKGERVMRFDLAGATVDISENEVEEKSSVNTSTK